MFDEKSRYADVAPVLVRDARGRMVEVVPPAPAPQQDVRGVHLRREGERPDHLATLYLSDPAGSWRIAEANDAMTAEVLSEAREIVIPEQARRGEP